MTYRQIHTDMWDDDWVLDLEVPEKLLWIYLFSNGRTHMIGLYEMSWKTAVFETGLDPEFISTAIAKFEAAGKLRVNGTWIWIKNMLTRNVNNLGSPKIQKGLESHIRSVPNSCPFKLTWLEHYNTVVAPQYGAPTISYDMISSDIAAADTFCSASASVSDSVSVSVSDLEVVEENAADVFLKVRGGAVNSLDIDSLNALIDDCEQHRQTLPRGSPGADVSGDCWVKDAILEGNASRKQGKLISLNYVRAIADRWMAEGYKAAWQSGDKKVAGL